MNTHETRPALTPVGTIRRVQALYAMGWNHVAMSEHTSLDARPIEAMANGRRDHITATVAVLVAELYDRLSMVIGPSAHVLAHARAIGWAPPLAWDDDRIDDHLANANYGQRVEPVLTVERSCIYDVLDGRAPLTYLPRACRAGLVAELRAAGLSDQQIAERLHTTVRTVYRHLRRHQDEAA